MEFRTGTEEEVTARLKKRTDFNILKGKKEIV